MFGKENGNNDKKNVWKPRKTARKSLFAHDSQSAKLGEIYHASVEDKKPKYKIYAEDLDRPWKRQIRAFTWIFGLIGIYI